MGEWIEVLVDGGLKRFSLRADAIGEVLEIGQLTDIAYTNMKGEPDALTTTTPYSEVMTQLCEAYPMGFKGQEK